MHKTTKLLSTAAALLVTLSAGCAGGPKSLPTKPDVVAYCHEAFLERIDLGTTNQSHGDMVTWSADVFDHKPANADRAAGEVVGMASGYMVVTHPNHEISKPDHDDREFRLSTMTMTWDETGDSLIFKGLHAYAHHAPRLDNDVTRAIIGGTGRFLGRSGIAKVIHDGDAWFRVEIYLAR